jgi:hypothetical protein
MALVVVGLVEEVDSARVPAGKAVAEGVVPETVAVLMGKAGA